MSAAGVRFPLLTVGTLFFVVAMGVGCSTAQPERTRPLPAPTVAQLVATDTPTFTVVVAATPAATAPPTAPPMPAVTPIESPTLAPFPTYTPLPTYTPYPTLTPVPMPTATPIPTPTATPAPTPTFSQNDLLEAEEERKKAGQIWVAAALACTDDKYDGRRKQSDLQTMYMAREISDEMLAKMDALPQHEQMTPEQKLEAARLFRAATVDLLELCLPEGAQLGGN